MKIKVCGMRDSDNIQELVKLSPDYIGFIFYDKSKRFVTDFPNASVPKKIKKVGVFVNESIENILVTVSNNQLDAAQLHGDESPEFCEELMLVFNHQSEIIKAFSVDEYFNFSVVKDYEPFCDLFIFDTKGLGYGGTGSKYDWKLLDKYKGEIPFLLSGGIGVDDSEQVLSFLRKQESKKCVGIDLNSGFEDEPGIKNIEKLNAFKKQLNV